ncbi:MAG: hypothetical protein PVF56_06385 [Desulfobacterales bacterium]|jgi:hypothetical protein
MKTTKIRKPQWIFAVLLLVFSSYSCGPDSMVGQLWGQMGELFKIKEAIDSTLTHGETSIHIQNGNVITLGLINTEYNDVDAPEREKVADEVIDVLLKQIEAKQEFQNIKTVVVNFIHHEKKFLVMDFTMTVDYYIYSL